jgi:acyl dehydratase
MKAQTVMLMTDTALPVSDEIAATALVGVGERIELVTRFTRDEISRFATLTMDSNPVHHDRGAAQRAGLPDVIASGQHTSALMSGLAASYFSRCDDGLQRDMLCLHFNFAYREPIVADSDVTLRWIVAGTEWSASLGGVIAQLEGKATVANALAVIARGTVLVRTASW